MKVWWSQIPIPVVAGAAAGVGTDAAMWANLNESLLSVVAIVSAGVLVRLARGVPFSAIDVLAADEARRLSVALKQSVRALAGLLAACLVTALCLASIGQVARVARSDSGSEAILPLAGQFDYGAFPVAFLLAFILVRSFAVVRGDIQIVDMQADILLRNRNRAAAADFRENVGTTSRKEFRATENYGRRVDEDPT